MAQVTAPLLDSTPNYKGAASLFLLIRKMTTDKVLDDLKSMGGTGRNGDQDLVKRRRMR